MTTLDQKISRVRHDCVKKVKKRSRKCLVDGCSELAIGSHVIQRKGALNKISESGKLIRPIADGFKKCIDFKEVGIKKPCTYKILCNKHDQEIFEYIEKGYVNFLDDRSLLLLSYRAVLAEIVKLENIVSATELEVEDKILRDYVDKGKYDNHMQKKKIQISRIFSYKKFLEEDLNSEGSKKFIFLTRIIDRIPICASSIFSDIRGRSREVEKMDGLDVVFLPEVIFNIVPIDDNKSVLTLGFLKKDESHVSDFLKDFPNGSQEEIEIFISDILLRSMNYWFSSPKFYEQFIKGRARELSEQIKEAVSNPVCRISYNLFKV
ncbi:MAG: hypothetical protein VXZ24_13160 [Pseudomonadota bacterium]|nr:hypothetical protein [Pseudomonadota bacterium]